MHQYLDTQVEIKTRWFIWKFDGKELGAYRTENQAEADLRRAVHAGWGENSMFMLDKDGSFLELGVQTGHTITAEQRGLSGI